MADARSAELSVADAMDTVRVAVQKKSKLGRPAFPDHRHVGWAARLDMRSVRAALAAWHIGGLLSESPWIRLSSIP